MRSVENKEEIQNEQVVERSEMLGGKNIIIFSNSLSNVFYHLGNMTELPWSYLFNWISSKPNINFKAITDKTTTT